MFTHTPTMKVSKVVDVPNLPERIRRAREADGRSLSEICGAAKMTAANWYRIESGETKVLPLDTLSKIEEVLGVSFDISFE